MSPLYFRRTSAAGLLACAVGTAVAQTGTPTTWTDPIDAPSETMPLAAHSLLLGIARSGQHFVAVGGRGEILLSDDAHEWKQAQVPTRITFTAVATVDAQIWAVGHEGIIAHSADGGDHWLIQRKDPLKPDADADEADRDPRQGAPLLAVMFVDATHGYAIGAYSLALRTDDGGTTWNPMTVATAAKPATDDDADTKGDAKHAQVFSQSELKIGEEAAPHLNAITRTGSGALLIVGERGSAFHSRDNGATWKRKQLPYDGSMFGVIGYDADHVLAFGLRGHVFESTDLGEHWSAVQTGTELSLMGGSGGSDGSAVIVGANGIVLMREKSGAAFASFADQPAGVISAVLTLDANTLLLAGENGIGTFQPTNSQH